jgi:hypothetical protein
VLLLGDLLLLSKSHLAVLISYLLHMPRRCHHIYTNLDVPFEANACT